MVSFSRISGSVSSSAMLLRARSIILRLRVELEDLDAQVGELRVHAGEVRAEHALLVVQADREQVAILLELVELQLRPLELALELAFLLGEPGHRRARPLELVVEVVLDVRVGDGVRDQRRALRLAVRDRDERQARILERLDRELPGQRAPERGQVVVRPRARRVVGIVLQPELLGRPLPDAGRLDDAVLRLVELLVRPERSRSRARRRPSSRAGPAAPCGSMISWQVAS